MTLNLFLNNLFYITIIIIINANNGRFTVLCNRYFSACDWRFIWCQFVADVKENPGGVPITVKYRRPYASTFVADSIGGTVVNSNRAHNYNRAVGRRLFASIVYNRVH